MIKKQTTPQTNKPTNKPNKNQKQNQKHYKESFSRAQTDTNFDWCISAENILVHLTLP